jgi:hypothetical protein
MFLHSTVRSNRRWTMLNNGPRSSKWTLQRIPSKTFIFCKRTIVPKTGLTAKRYVLYTLLLFDTPSSLTRQDLTAALHQCRTTTMSKLQELFFSMYASYSLSIQKHAATINVSPIPSTLPPKSVALLLHHSTPQNLPFVLPPAYPCFYLPSCLPRSQSHI